LKAYAQEVGLDVAACEQCVSSGTYQATVQQDVEEGTRAGVTGTPAFCINGRRVAGAPPLESFTRVIEDERARAR
jgi:predicted DsbA family dithiol-disulfide isomerase